MLREVTGSKNLNWNAGVEALIKKNLLINNYQGAIDCCLKVNRVYEAFLIAKSHPTESQKYIEFFNQKCLEKQDEYFINNTLVPLS